MEGGEVSPSLIPDRGIPPGCSVHVFLCFLCPSHWGSTGSPGTVTPTLPPSGPQPWTPVSSHKDSLQKLFSFRQSHRVPGSQRRLAARDTRATLALSTSLTSRGTSPWSHRPLRTQMSDFKILCAPRPLILRDPVTYDMCFRDSRAQQCLWPPRRLSHDPHV